MKNRLIPVIFAFLAVTSVNAQKCGTYDGYLEKQIQNYPDFYQKLESQNQKLEAENKEALKNLMPYKTEDGKKIIPVVIHNIYNSVGGALSDATIQAAIDALNRNINGQSEKLLEMYQNQYLKTPDIFAAVRGIANVEFRLAKITPTCETCTPQSTSGVNRIFTDITSLGSNGPDPVKALSYWNSYQYLNIWTVPSFGGDAGGGLLGYAQFPFSGMMSTDGVVLKAAEMGNASSSTLTHEVGHWLGLRHIWGDAECGDDYIKDTPSHRFDNNGASESSPTPPGHPKPTPALFPYHVGFINPNTGAVPWGCVADSLNPAGEMFMNYMDYTRDEYTTMFSAGQIAVMNETLDGLYDEDAGTSGIGFREYMWSADNIAATGVSDGYLTPTCAQKANFAITTGISSICKGEDIIIKGNQTQFGNGNVTEISWDFGDNTFSANDNANYLTHTYATEGLFDVSFTVVYNETTEARAASLSDLDLSNASSYDSIVKTLIVQGEESELAAMGAANIALHLDVDSFSINSFWKNHAPEDSVVGAHSSFFLGLDTFQLIFSAKKGDSLEIEDYDRLALCFITWEQDSIDWAGDTSIFYYGSYESNAFKAYFMDTLFYRGELEQTTYVTYYANSCTSTIVKENFISVNPTSSSNAAGSYTYSFENAADLSDDWHITTNTADGDWSFNSTQNSSWEWVNGVAVSGNASIMIDKENLTLGSDELISEAYNLSALSNPAIKFSYSGAAANNFPANELKVYYSDDCGEVWRNLGALTPVEVASAGLYTTNFKPDASEWNDIIMTKAQLRNDNIKFKFEYVTIGSANNFYIDNIQIGEESALFTPVISASKLSIFPNPTNGQAVIRLENLADMNVEVKLVNMLGAEVRNLFEGEIVSNYYVLDKVDLSTLETGIYFVKVVANGNIVTTDKLILSK